MSASPPAGAPIAQHVPGMIMIGSAGRNSGKTEFACELIRNLQRTATVVGLKVSTIYGDGQVCLRGNDGCGVCTTLEGDYCLTEEDDPARPKDTGRLLAAGADRVFWLRVREGHLAEGLALFLDQRRPGEFVVCESNGLRTVCEPDLFFMVKSVAGTDRKRSARIVYHLADREVSFTGGEAAVEASHGGNESPGAPFDFDVREIRHVDGRFFWTGDSAAILLAGGKSTRMGVDKRFLSIDGQPLIHRVHRQIAAVFGEVIVSLAGRSDGEAGIPGGGVLPGARIVSDELSDAGPIGGIASALAASNRDLNLVVACDIPTIPIELIQTMLRLGRSHDVVVPRHSNGKLEPLFAVYRRSVLLALRSLIESGERRPRRLFDLVDTAFLDLSENIRLTNLNTPDEYESFLSSKQVMDRSLSSLQH